MHPRAIVRFFFAGLIVLTASCAPRVIIKRGGPCPGWVDRMPRQEGKLCAVGYSGPTFYQQDCVKNAAENARAHLAESISVTIRAVTIDISDGTRGYFDKDVFVEGSESASEEVLHGSEIEAQWVDMDGQRGARNGCFAYVCIDPDKPVEKMVKKLEEKKVPHKTVEQVRENAAAAFDELEKLEEQKRLEQESAAPAEEQTEDTGTGEDSTEEPAADEQPEDAPPAEQPPAEKRPADGEEEDKEEEENQQDDDSGDATPAVRTIQLPQD